MTREEARRILNMTPQELRLNDVSVEDEEQARQMAIDAFLEEKPHGEWIDYQDEKYSYLANCSKCGYQMDTHEEHGYFNFCPNCGADMRVSKELNSEIEKSNSEKTCLNCGTSEQECELGNRARHGFCGNWTERR